MTANNNKDMPAADSHVIVNNNHFVEPEKLKEHYNLNVGLCKSRANRNCASNPRCIKGLGQKHWLVDSTGSESEDENIPSDRKLKYCGLVNLGATCYMNSFLQLWYHNVNLRKAFYNWRPSTQDDGDRPNEIVILQSIFAMMQFSKKASVDPQPFAKSLKLDESLQQDTHEFTNLLINFIKSKLFGETDKSIDETIDEQYLTKMANVNKCTHCNQRSEQESKSYELLLNVKDCDNNGFKKIDECIRDYLKEENLTGSNQYACRNCNCKRDAQRFTELRHLPPMLNMQLLRFEVSGNGSKKINNKISFPHKLDMNQFMGEIYQNEENANYQLFAALFHEGKTANSGHYITLIKRENSWYQFNDKQVTKLKSFDVKFKNDEDSDENKENGTKEKKNKDWETSKNAYMLVYRRESEADIELPNLISECNLPDNLTEMINIDNIEFQKEKEMETLHQTTVKEIYKCMEVPPEVNEFDIINKDWLSTFFAAKASSDITKVNNEPLLCPHKKLDASKPFKIISRKSADEIYEKYGGGPRMQVEDDFCSVCAFSKLRLDSLKETMKVDSKEISKLSKFKNNGNTHYWIGKESFKKWKEMCETSFKKQLEDNEVIEDCPNKNFNYDVYCEHGQLTSDESKMRSVQESIWDIFEKHFPNAPKYSVTADKCPDCLEIDKKNAEIRFGNSSLGAQQKESLKNLIQYPNMSWDDVVDGPVYNLLSSKFYKNWKRFLSNPNNSPPDSVDNESILCDTHKRFLFPPQDDSYVGPNEKYIIIPDTEWRKLVSFYKFDNAISFFKLEDQQIISAPEFCNGCFADYLEMERLKSFEYTNGIIEIHKIETQDDNSANNSDSEAPKKLKGEASENGGPPKINGDQISAENVRRSSRRRRYRNNLVIKVSSSWKLKEIKQQIMEHFKVATFDQILMLNDREFNSSHNNLTLSELEIASNAILTLRVDDKTDENGISDSSIEATSSSRGGFKGTQLHQL